VQFMAISQFKTQASEVLDQMAQSDEAIKDYIEAQTLEETRWQETLKALESVRQGKVVDGDIVHEWMNSWGTANELDPPSFSKDI